jgi:hypothetical protein
MSNELFDGAAIHAKRGASRNGSPFQNDKAFKRPVSVAVMWFRAIRDVLALVAFVALTFAVASAFPQLF